MRALILTEGGGEYGFGHLTRCQALYHAFGERGVESTVLVRGDPGALSILQGCRIVFFDWIADGERLRKSLRGVDCAIVDSYRADEACCARIADLVRVPVFMDDTQRIRYPSGIILNGGIDASPALYRPFVGDILAGPSYVLLRRSFWDRATADVRERIDNVLVIMGGTDFRGLSSIAAQAVADVLVGSVTIHVVCGDAKPTSDDLQAMNGTRLEVHRRLGEAELVALMASMDLAVSAGGQTLNELARLGIPTVALRVADNQDANVQAFARHGCVRDAGWWNDTAITESLRRAIQETIPRPIREQMHRSGTQIIDGQGARRVATLLINRMEQALR